MKEINLKNIFPLKKAEFDKSEIYDIAIIGAGVVGCAIFKEFCQNGAKTILIEKENDILEGASKGNSALLHTGFDAPEDSLELKCVKAGYEEYLKIKEELNLSILKTSALVVAWNDEQLQKLDSIYQKGIRNGIKDLEEIDRKTLLKMEPNLSKNAKGAIWVKGESVIDAWSAPLAYLKEGVRYGGETAFSHKVLSAEHKDCYWEILTSRGHIKTNTIINAAGLYGDDVEKIRGGEGFKIIPRKGQFLVYDKTAYELINSIILPVPTKRTKGVVVTKTAFGNILVGPTAEDQESKTDTSTKREMLIQLRKKAYEILPKLKEHQITTVFAGLRPASDETFYRIEYNKEKEWIRVGGIRSTGLTASLGIAKYVFNLYGKKFEKKEPQDKIEKVPNISEFSERDYKKPGFKKIVCHCELATDREIENALRGKCSAGTLGGLKRRTRAMMGRCQGFNCTADIAEMIEKANNEK